MPSRQESSSSGYLAAGIGALVAGVGTYVVAGLSDPATDISRTQFLSLDGKNELELEGMTILAFMVIAGIAAVIGCFGTLWLLRYTYSLHTAVLSGLLLMGGAALIEEVHTDLPPSQMGKAYMFGALPFICGVIARMVVVALRRDDAKKRRGTGDAASTRGQ